MGVVNTTGLKFQPPNIEILSMSNNTGLINDIIQIDGINFDYADSIKFNNTINCVSSFNSLTEGNFTVPFDGNTGFVNVHGDFITLTGISPKPFWTMFEITNFSPNRSPSGEQINFQGIHFNTLTGVNFQAEAIKDDCDFLLSGSNLSFFDLQGGFLSGNAEAVFIQNINVIPEQINTYISKKQDFDLISGNRFQAKFTTTPQNNIYENHILSFKTGIYSGFYIFNTTINSGIVNQYQTAKINLPISFDTLNYQIYPSFVSSSGISNFFISGKDFSSFHMNFQSGLSENTSFNFLAISGGSTHQLASTNLKSSAVSTINGIFSYSKNISTQYNKLYAPFLLTSIEINDSDLTENIFRNFDLPSGLNINLIYEKYNSGIYSNLYSISDVNILSNGSGYSSGNLLTFSGSGLSSLTYGILKIIEVSSGSGAIPTGAVNTIEIVNSGIFTGNFGSNTSTTSGYFYNVSNLTNKSFDFDLNPTTGDVPYVLNYLLIDDPNVDFNRFIYDYSTGFYQKIYFVPGQENDLLTPVSSNNLNISGTINGSGTCIIPKSDYYINGPIVFLGLFGYERRDFGNFKEIPDPISVTPSGINTRGSVIISGRSFKKANLIDGTGEYNSIIVKFRNITNPKQKNDFFNTFYIIDDQTLSGSIELGSYLTGSYVIQALTEDGEIYE
jgi:hypothetical protein